MSAAFRAVLAVMAAGFAWLSVDGFRNELTPVALMWVPLAGVAAIIFAVTAAAPTQNRVHAMIASALVVSVARGVAWFANAVPTPGVIWLMLVVPALLVVWRAAISQVRPR